jgi:hypothetical protein
MRPFRVFHVTFPRLPAPFARRLRNRYAHRAEVLCASYTLGPRSRMPPSPLGLGLGCLTALRAEDFAPGFWGSLPHHYWGLCPDIYGVAAPRQTG